MDQTPTFGVTRLVRHLSLETPPGVRAWQAHQDAGPNSELRRQMIEAEETTFPPIFLTPVADFLLCPRCKRELPPGATESAT